VGAASFIQIAAVAVGLLGLCFFAFFGAYYVRNRRIALGRGEQSVDDVGERPIGAASGREQSVDDVEWEKEGA